MSLTPNWNYCKCATWRRLSWRIFSCPFSAETLTASGFRVYLVMNLTVFRELWKEGYHWLLVFPEDTPFRRPPEHHQLPSALSPIDASASENGGPMGPVILCTNLCKLPQSQRAHDLTSHTLTYVLTRVLDSDQRNSNLWGHTRKMSRTANSDVSAVAISSASHPFHCWPPVSAPDKSLLLITAPMD